MIKKQSIITVILAASIIGLAVWQGWLFFRGRSIKAQKNINSDPFAGLTIPEKYNRDPDVKAVVEAQLAGTIKMYKQKPNIWETWIAIGNIKRQLSDFNGAIAAYQRSIEMQGNNILGERNIAEVYDTDLKDYEKAAAHYRAALNNDFTDIGLYKSLAFLEFKKLGNNEEAEKTYIQGLQKTGFNSELLLALIDFYKATGNTEKYKENSALLLEQHPDNAAFKKAYGSAVAN